MGLLNSLGLAPAKLKPEPVPGMIDVNVPFADPAAERRARRKAARKGHAQGDVINAALASTGEPVVTTDEELDMITTEQGNNQTPVSQVAPRSVYTPVPASLLRGGEAAGSVTPKIDIHVDPTVDGKGVDVGATVNVTDRLIAPETLGNGELRSLKKGVGPGQEGVTFKVPEPLVLDHEQLHVVIAARTASAIASFAAKAFASALDQKQRDKLDKLLSDIAEEVRQSVDGMLHDETIPRHRLGIPKAEKAAKRLLAGNDVERAVRTALLDAVRRHSRRLAKFR